MNLGLPDGIKITSDGFYKLMEVEDEIKATLLEGTQNIWALREPVEIEEGVTLSDIFCIVARNEELLDFLRYYSKCRLIKEYHEKALNPPDELTDLKYLEIGWEGRLWLDPKLDREIDIFTDVCGRGPKEKEDMPDVENEQGLIRYGIDLTPVNQLANLPVVLNQDLTITLIGEEGDKVPGEGIKKVEKYAHIHTRREFTLLDVLDALYWEISFFGSEEDKIEAKERLTETAEEIEQQVKDGIAQPINPESEGNKIILSDQVRDFFGMPSNLDERITESAEDQND